jgi:hypothetical protein
MRSAVVVKAINREHILEEIRRTAAANGSVPLDSRGFFNETGIPVSAWLGPKLNSDGQVATGSVGQRDARAVDGR